MARPRSFDPGDVLERAVDLFRQGGFEGISVVELTERLGICRQSLYNTFGDKRGLFLAALERYGERQIDSRLELLAAEGSPLSHVRTVLRGMAALATTCPDDGCLSVTALIEHGDDPDTMAVIQRQVERLERGLEDALERAQQAGELTDAARPTRLARSMTTLFYGLGVLSRLPESGARIGDAVASALEALDDVAA